MWAGGERLARSTHPYQPARSADRHEVCISHQSGFQAMMPVAERAHRYSIAIHCPDCDEEEMAVRIQLATLRDQATVGMLRASDEPRQTLAQVARLSSIAVYAGMPTSRLLRVFSALELLSYAGRMVEIALRDE